MSNITERQFQQLKRSVEEAQRTYHEQCGSLKRLMSELESVWGCTTIAEAKALLKQKQKELAAASEKATKLYGRYADKYLSDNIDAEDED